MSSRIGFRGHDRLQSLAAEIGQGAIAVSCDVTIPEQVETAVADVLAHFGRIDILVNNAGGVAGMRSFEELTDADWLATIELNLMSAVRMTRAVLPGMLEAGWGRIINISSESALQPDPVMADYNSAKGALNSFTKTLSKAYGRRGVLVNGVSPAFTETPILTRLVDEAAAAKGVTREEMFVDMLAKFRPHLEVGRPGTPAETAAAVAFLASERASFINGAILRVDGGSVASV